jgi:hypothetical protein
MLADLLGSFLIESAAILLFLGFVSKKLDIDISRFSAVTYAIVLSLYTDDHGLLIIATGLFVISEIDRIEFRIPDEFTKSALFVFTLMANGDWDLLAIAWLWMAVMYVLTFFLPQAIGRGDVKLIGSLILATPWMVNMAPAKFLLSLLLLSSSLALPGAMRNRRKRGQIAFAPAISGAALLLFGIGVI